MRSSLLVTSLALAATVAALPASTHVVHEKRGSTSSWTKLSEVQLDQRISLPVRIGLTQSNLDSGYDLLLDVADPTSKNYGKHWTHTQVRSNLKNTLMRV